MNMPASNSLASTAASETRRTHPIRSYSLDDKIGNGSGKAAAKAGSSIIDRIIARALDGQRQGHRTESMGEEITVGHPSTPVSSRRSPTSS
jgi:hypothetical protein